MASKVRLYVDHPLGEGQSVALSREQANYLFAVMRMPVGTVLSLINGRDGEWDAEVMEAGKRAGLLRVTAQTLPLQTPPDLWLMFAPIKKDRTAFIVEKATELGAAKIIPVQTDFTQSNNRVRQDKLQAYAVEATEQCGGTYVPEVTDLQNLDQLLDSWDKGRMIMHCDEDLTEWPQKYGVSQFERPPGPWAILIGPEGGFSDREKRRLSEDLRGTIISVSLGPRILRADTAAVAALTLWQNTLGDWT